MGKLRNEKKLVCVATEHQYGRHLFECITSNHYHFQSDVEAACLQGMQFSLRLH